MKMTSKTLKSVFPSKVIVTKKIKSTAKKAKILEPDLSSAFIFQPVKVPVCCKRCKDFIAIENKVLNIFTVDCRKKIFFPVKKQTCQGEKS